MRVVIDRELCFGHARCMAHCPEVFGVDDEGHGLVLLPGVPAELADRVRECVERCPEAAISVTD